MMQKACSFGLKKSRIRINQLKYVCISNRISCFSSINGINGGNNQKDNELNEKLRAKEQKEMTPLELLIQHSSGIRAMHEQNKVDIEKLEFNISEYEEVVIKETEEKETDDDNENEDDNDNENVNENVNEKVNENKDVHESEDDNQEDAMSYSSSERLSSKHKKPMNRKKVLSSTERLKKRIAFDDTIDLEHGLRDLELSNQDKRIMRHIRRSKDANKICSNCGEIGHINKYCPLPRICRYCGDIGHENNKCPYREAQMVQVQKKMSPKEKAKKIKEAMDKEIDEYLSSLDQNTGRKKQ
jgi:hypothetical protein